MENVDEENVGKLDEGWVRMQPNRENMNVNQFKSRIALKTGI